jgi:16S rRNA (guanine1207-N2)-methyltransferase
MRDEEDPAGRLLAGAPVEAGSKVLVMEGGDGSLLSGAVRDAGSIHFQNNDCNHHKAAEAAAAALKHPDLRLHLSDLPRPEGDIAPEENWPGQVTFPAATFDAVLCRLGKGTAAILGAIQGAFGLLKEGGSLFLCGANREGVKSAAQKAEGHFGNAELLTLKSSCRLLRFRKTTALPVEPVPDPGYFRPVPLNLDLPGQAPIPYLSKPGIFSYRTPDVGTALLAAHLRTQGSLQDWTGLRVLDLGCGAGPLALAAHRLGANSITAVDVQAAAVAAAHRNLEAAGANAVVLCTNLTDNIHGEFDLILSNPPFHEGHGTDYGFPARVLDAALPRLAAGGRMLLVANQFLDYPALARERGHGCETLAQSKGFRVLSVTR